MSQRTMMNQTNRKTATKLLLINWSRFQNVTVRLEGSTLFTGVNGSGKTTVLDAMLYLLTGSSKFNSAAQDRERTVLGYVRGDTKSNGEDRYLRTGAIVSYIAMEFWSPIENAYLVVGVCMESANETDETSSWFVCKDTKMDDISFSRVEENKLYVTPPRQLTINGSKIKSSDLMRRDKGTEQILRALGLRCDTKKYRAKLLKMMAFKPENNINQFIQECVLEPGKINSLKELREQKSYFEELREEYRELGEGKKKLEEIEQKTQEYEKKYRMHGIRELMLKYQEVKAKEEETERETLRQQNLKEQLKSLEQKKVDINEQLKYARERLQAAETNDLYMDMKSSIQSMEEHLKDLDRQIERYGEKTDELKKVQQTLTDKLSWLLEEGIEADADRLYLKNLAETGYSKEKKMSLFRQLCLYAENKKEALGEKKYRIGDEEDKLLDELQEISEQLAQLEANRLIEPRKVKEVKEVISNELEKRGIHTDVRTFAELVQDIKDEEWRMAIETFLGNKRHNIIVDGKYCHEALEILHEKHLHAGTIVLTDKLPDTEITRGSAAEQLEIPNVYARRYANYLLNGIYLCTDLRELHDHPKGGLMKDGTLAKSYAVSLMDMSDTKVCLGSRAIELQKKDALKRQKELNEKLPALRKNQEFIQNRLKQLDDVVWKVDDYMFSAPEELENANKEKKGVEGEIKNIKSNPSFTKVLEEQQRAKNYYDEVMKRLEINSSDIGVCKDTILNIENSLKQLAAEIYDDRQHYDEACNNHMEWKQPMLEEYEKLRKRQDGAIVIKKKTVDNMKGERDLSREIMENAQLEYCKIAKIDMFQRGPAYIPFYREQYRKIANVKIEKARTQLEEQSKRLESAFMNDFVAEINETVQDAKREIDIINYELKQLPFGNDTYRFEMKEKSERAVFFRICRRLENYMGSPEVYMNSMRDDEEMEHDIEEFMSIILEETDEDEYTDYRNYFTYDMKIVSTQGSKIVTSDLSKKQGSASNGEKQTPYFIILAASLMQYYPKQSCCARLAFIDEAFSALSRERIEQMVKYLEENSFQVIYAAPPEKIGSIGKLIDSTASLVIQERYTGIVEGLVKEYELYIE